MDPWGLSPDTDVTTFFHAGNIEGPIDPSMGRMGLDFNPAGQGGFYVTTDANQAAEWAARRGTSVTQFNVPNTELEALNIKSFPSANSEWGEFVTQGRAGTLAHTFDAVEGPMLRNVHQVMSSGARPLARGSQFAIFTKKAAAVFDRFKVGGGCG
ncbi:DUF3990 domain-containing protein [Paraburkholderia tropica]|uniref:DUF3990 domain-containing protein n=1 Tax=Paraburkholderia tropica TaxID=92647 RepID=UPI003B8A875A